MTSKECLKTLCKSISYAKLSCKELIELYELIKQDLDRLEKIEREHEKLKEKYKHRAETSNDLCEAVKLYEKVFEILNNKFKYELGVSVVNEKYHYSLEFLFN